MWFQSSMAIWFTKQYKKKVWKKYCMEYMQWIPFRGLEINPIRLNMWQMKMKSGKLEGKNSLVWFQFEFSNRNTNCNLEVLTMKVKTNYNVDDAIAFIFDGNQWDLWVHSSDEEENDEIEDTVQSIVSDDELTDVQNLTMTLLLLL